MSFDFGSFLFFEEENYFMKLKNPFFHFEYVHDVRFPN